MSPARPAVLGPTSKRYAPRSIIMPRRTCATATGVPIWQAAGYLGMSAEMIERSYGHHHPNYVLRLMRSRQDNRRTFH
jgi:hypothetical protein